MTRLQTTDGAMTASLSDVTSRLGAGHVLIADPNEATRGRREGQLRAAGFRVSLARTGFEAIVKATCHMPDWILIDASLTGLGAAETGQLITTCPVTSHIPVIQLAAGQRLPQRMFARLRRVPA